MPFPSSIKIALIAGTVAAVSLTGPEAARSQSVPLVLTCPARLATMQSAAAVPGWQQQRTTKGRLASVGFYDGDVADDFELAPNGGGKKGRVTTTVHRFTANRSAINFVCRYHGTDIVLSRALPTSIKQCTITADAMSPAATSDRIACS